MCHYGIKDEYMQEEIFFKNDDPEDKYPQKKMAFIECFKDVRHISCVLCFLSAFKIVQLAEYKRQIKYGMETCSLS